MWSTLFDQPVDLVIRVIVIIALFWVAGQLVIRAVRAAAKRAGVSTAQIRIVTETLTFVVVVLAIVAVVHASGLTSEFTALTISGLIAIALSLAVQTTLSNVISGILLLIDNTLRISDVVEYSGIKGEVVKIGLRNSWIKTSEGHLVVISNSQIANGPFTNYSAGERLLGRL
jgi:small-conductance mechanosensitive channel